MTSKAQGSADRHIPQPLSNRATLASRPMRRLREEIERRLCAYSAAAAAAGISLLAAAPPAQADIIHTPANVPVSEFDSTSISLNHLAPDLVFFGTVISGSTLRGDVDGGGLWVRQQSQGRGLIIGPLQKGDVIGPSRAFDSSARLAHGVYFFYNRRLSSSGPWLNQQGFLGVKFLIASQVHFGWVQLQEHGNFNGDQSGVVEGWAYDTVADQSIRAGQTTTPEPGTLSLLALASLGLGFWRRKKQAARTDK